MTTYHQMEAEYETYCTAQGLPKMSADELMLEDSTTAEQRAWLQQFHDEWNALATASTTAA